MNIGKDDIVFNEVSVGLPLLLVYCVCWDKIEQNKIPLHPPLPAANTWTGNNCKRSPLTW